MAVAFLYGIRKSLDHPFNEIMCVCVCVRVWDLYIFVELFVCNVYCFHFPYRCQTKLNGSTVLVYIYTFSCERCYTCPYVLYTSALVLVKSDALQHDSVHTK